MRAVTEKKQMLKKSAPIPILEISSEHPYTRPMN